jgi:hypothetical protein
VTFSAHNKTGGESSQTITIRVLNTKTLKLNKIGDKTVKIGKELKFRVTAKDSLDKTKALTFGAIRLPKGARFTAIGDFTWTPTKKDIGTYRTRFYVKDPGSNRRHSEVITIRVQ